MKEYVLYCATCKLYSLIIIVIGKSCFLLNVSYYRMLWSTRSTQPAYRSGREREHPLTASSKTARIYCRRLHHMIVM